MSVIVKGMEMPYGCADCDFCGGIIMPDGIYCCDCPTEASHGKNISDAINNDARADICPLVEIPTPHGRLGDLDALWDRMYKYIDNEGAKMPFGDNDFMIHRDSACELIEDAPTVIEAEGSEE